MDTQAVSQVVEKINLARAQGDRCMGNVFNKSAAEWKEIFNEAAKELNMPIVHIPAIKGGSIRDVEDHAVRLVDAFQKAANGPAIILVDTSNNRAVKNQNMNMAIANFTENLTHRFPQAIFAQAVTEGTCATSVNFYCMNPKTPNMTGRIDPV